MYKEPIGLYIFRFLVGACVAFFMGMLYWSLDLQERDLKQLRQDVLSLKHELKVSKTEMQKTREDVLETMLLEQENNRELLKGILHNQASLEQLKTGSISSSSVQGNSSIKLGAAKKSRRSTSQYEDQDSPNLLTSDPYYTKTLPKMLGESFSPKGERRSSMLGKPEDLHPFSNWSDVSSLRNLCIIPVSLTHVGKYEDMGPGLARKLELRKDDQGRPEYWVHLRKDIFWQALEQRFCSDGIQLASSFKERHPVTAWDFKFHYDAMMNPYNEESAAVAKRNYYQDIEEFRVLDDHTFVVRWKAKELVDGEQKELRMKYQAKGLTGSLTPLPRFVYQYFPDGSKIVQDDRDPDTYRKHSVWAQNFSQHWAKNIIVSCGPWLFDGMSEKEVRFKRNEEFFNPYAVLFDSYLITFKDSPESVWQSFKAGKFDYIGLSPALVPEWKKFKKSSKLQAQKKEGASIEDMEYLSRIYAYVGWNQKKHYFSDKKIRQALTMSIDRKRIIEYNLHGRGIEITGTFFRYSPSYDASIDTWPFDPKKAREILEEQGWYDSDGDGIREKEINGKKVPFRFTLTYPVKNTTAKPIVEYISKALREVGIDCKLQGVELADLSNAFDEKSFDAIYLGWSLGSPPENPRQLWHSEGAKEKGSSNAIGFRNKEADKIIDALDYEDDIDKRNALYHKFHQIIHKEQPYTFLYTPKSTLLYREFVENVFIPVEEQSVIPGANVSEPDLSVIWKKEQGEQKQ